MCMENLTTYDSVHQLGNGSTYICMVWCGVVVRVYPSPRSIRTEYEYRMMARRI